MPSTDSEAGARGQPPVFVMLPSGRAACAPGGSIPAMGTAVKILGVVQFLTAVASVGLGVGVLLFTCQDSQIITGIWVGAVIMVTGILGISAGSSKDQCPLSCYHVMSIIGILAGTALITIQVLAVLRELTTCADTTATCPALCLTFNTLLFSTGLVHFFLSLASAVLSITLYSRIAKSKEQVVPLVPYPLPNSHRAAVRSLQDPAARLQTSGSTQNGDVQLNYVDFSDEDFKFA